MSTPLRWSLLSALFVTAATALPASAQPIPQSVPGLPDRVVQGTSYHVFTEPGAPTIEVVMVRLGSGGLYRIAEGTTLTELLALSGGTAPPSQETQQIIRTSAIRVLRTTGSTRQTIYEATPEQLIREPGQHPLLADGDLVEVVSTVEERPNRFTFRDGLEVATRIASVVSLILLLSRRIN